MDLEKKLGELKERKEGALMPHVYYGDPSTNFSDKLIETLSINGADIIEFGIPFSDPTADGPTFQAVCNRALGGGVTPSNCIQGLKRLRDEGLGTPVIVTTYYNIPYVMGVENFLKKIKSAGAQGVIVPNLPYEEAGILKKEAKKYDLHVILQIAPTTNEKRLIKITEAASGFIYVINVEGVTGTSARFKSSTSKIIEQVRKHTDLPILAGFGISNREQALSLIASGANGVVAGSVFARIYENNISEPERSLQKISYLVKELKSGVTEGYRSKYKK